MAGKTSAVIGVMLVAILAFASSAQATFPGDNGKIAATPAVTDNSFFYMVNPDGTALTTIGLKAQAVAWSPDGSRFAYEYQSGDGYPRQLFVASADGSNSVFLTTGWSPTWSPDGTRIAFLNDDQLYVMNSDGTKVRLVAGVFPRSDSLQWSPDGRQFAFAWGFDIWMINSDGTGLKNLTNTTTQDSYGIELGPSWSPDSTRIVFTANTIDLQPNFFQTFIFNRDGSGRARIETPISARRATWSPDGTQIAFGNICDVDSCGLWVMNVDGTGLHPITEGFIGTGQLDWQPIVRPFPSYANASKKCKALPGDYRNHGHCVKASR